MKRLIKHFYRSISVLCTPESETFAMLNVSLCIRLFRRVNAPCTASLLTVDSVLLM